MRQPFVLIVRPQCIIYKAKCDRLPFFFHFLCSRRHTFIRPEVSSNLGRAHISISSSLNISVLKSMTVAKTIKMKSEKHYDIQFFKVLRTISFPWTRKKILLLILLLQFPCTSPYSCVSVVSFQVPHSYCQYLRL